MKKRKPFTDTDVAAVFAAYPKEIRADLLRLRQLILDTAPATEGVGELEETLKWGQPSYLTSKSRSGSTIRIDRTKSPGQYAMYFNCQTSLIDAFRQIYPGEFSYEGSRAIIFEQADELPEEPLRHCIALALTYHRRQGRR